VKLNSYVSSPDCLNRLLVDENFGDSSEIEKAMGAIEGENSLIDRMSLGVLTQQSPRKEGPEATPESFQMFCESLAAHRFKGIVVIALSKVHSPALAAILYDRCFKVRYEIAQFLRRKRFDVWPLRLEQILAIAELACVSGGESVVIAEHDLGFEFAVPDANGRRDPRFPLRLKVAEPEEINPDYLGALAFRRHSGFLPGQRRRSDKTARRDSPWKLWQLDPEAESREWIVAEFPQYRVRERFQKLVCEVFGEEEALPNRLQDRKRYYGHYHRVALTAIRLARALAIRTLEGTPFCGTIFLPGDYKQTLPDHPLPDRNQEIVGLPYEEQEKRVFFNFDFRDSISDFLELAQSQTMRVWVDPRNGQIRCIAHAAGPSTTEATGLRFLDMTHHYPQAGMWIQILGNGRVEVYARRKMDQKTEQMVDGPATAEFILRYDGFEWERDPTADLKRRLDAFFRGEDEGADPKRRRRVIGPAVMRMLDQNESSIVVLVSECEKEPFQGADGETLKIEDLRLEQMRLGVSIARSPDGNPLNVTSLNYETLAGMLHTDGAHFIARDGAILRLNMRVANTAEKSPAESRSVASDPGSGANSARELQEALPNSLVIKVSASGRVKFFK